MELRWDPLLREWVIVSGVRERRPALQDTYCPFCPGSTELPPQWEVASIPNSFPALVEEPPLPSADCGPPFKCAPARGVCEVVLYTQDHNASLSSLSVELITKLVELWRERYKSLGQLSYVKYVFIFENKGREIGVTLDHPHGQIYGFPFIPPRIQTELRSSRRHWAAKRRCLFCDIVKSEIEAEKRLVSQNSEFVCFLPFFAHWPYGVHIYPRKHLRSLLQLSKRQRRLFAMMLKDTVLRFDNLFGMSFPYMMVFHQQPTDGREYPYYHFHVEFYPPLRDRGKIKFFASVETGAGATTFDYVPEEKALELRSSPGFIEQQPVGP